MSMQEQEHVIRWNAGEGIYFAGVTDGEPLWSSTGIHVFGSQAEALAMQQYFPDNWTMKNAEIVPYGPVPQPRG